MWNKTIRIVFMGIVLLVAACHPTLADDKTQRSDQTDSGGEVMTSERMTAIVKNYDEDAEASGSRIVFKVRDRELMIVYDDNADRMRIVTPIMQSGAVPQEVYERMLQANFDAVLDSRYAIANDIIWSTFIHRLSSLNEDDLLSGIAQTYAAAETFGSTYTSGVIVFGGGDSNSLHEELLEELEKLPKKEDTGI